MAEELHLQERVHFLGWQSSAEVKQQYLKANLFLHPSRHEGMPNAVLEAMASGLPVIASRISGNEELVLEDQTGLLVPVEDADGLREALRSLLHEPEQRRAMGDAGRGRIQQSFGWERVADQYRSILREAAG
jgi:glycosyltransferase involved in cell wall biosynthesis